MVALADRFCREANTEEERTARNSRRPENAYPRFFLQRKNRGPARNNRILSAKYFDPELGWYYYGKRYYIPPLGRWASRDPIGEWGGIQLYCFTGNNANNAIDCLGESWKELIVKVVVWLATGEGPPPPPPAPPPSVPPIEQPPIPGVPGPDPDPDPDDGGTHGRIVGIGTVSKCALGAAGLYTAARLLARCNAYTQAAALGLAVVAVISETASAEEGKDCCPPEKPEPEPNPFVCPVLFMPLL